MSTYRSSPFIFGPPVRGDDFVNREAQLHSVFNRLVTGQSTIIVGEPHTGKTSFLLRLTDSDTLHLISGEILSTLHRVFIDLLDIPHDFTPESFWEYALYDLTQNPGRRPIGETIELVRERNYDKYSLEKLFKTLDRQNRKLVLLLDEFERLIEHENFQNPEFFSRLRNLSNNTGGLVLIPACRITVAELIKRGRKILDIGSPFFNQMSQETLKPFDDKSIDILLGKAGEEFSIQDQQFIRRVAGSNPFVLQAMAATLLETSGADRYQRASERFYERIAFHYDELWYAMSDETRITAIVLSLLEFGGRVFGSEFNYGEIERVDQYGLALRKLSDRGLAKLVEENEGWILDWEHLLAWRGQRWTIESQAFAWWVRDVVISKSRKVHQYDEWLQNKRYKLLLTEEQWGILINKFKNAPAWAIHGIGTLARELWNGLNKK